MFVLFRLLKIQHPVLPIVVIECVVRVLFLKRYEEQFFGMFRSLLVGLLAGRKGSANGKESKKKGLLKI